MGGVIIVGWGHRKEKVLGPADKFPCPRCRHEDFFELVKFADYATLFFVPVIPYKTIYGLRCPVCTYCIEVPAHEVESRRARCESLLQEVRR